MHRNKALILAAIVVAVVMTLFPPWSVRERLSWDSGFGPEHVAGYAFIASPPDRPAKAELMQELAESLRRDNKGIDDRINAEVKVGHLTDQEADLIYKRGVNEPSLQGLRGIFNTSVASVDLGRLLLQFAALALVTSGAIFALRRPGNQQYAPHSGERETNLRAA